MRKVMGIRGQVWVETVIYTLIGLAIMGLILAMAKPKIDQKKDEIVIEQAIEAMRNINEKIYEVQRAAGNRRAVDLKIGRGTITIDTENDSIYWDMDVSYEYSEADINVPLGDLNVTTLVASPWRVQLKMGYAVDIQYNNQSSGTHNFDQAPTPYRIIIENKGTNIDLREA